MNRHKKDLSKWLKRSIAFTSDCLCIIVAWILAESLANPLGSLPLNTILIAEFSLIEVSICIICGLYRGIWRFASIPDLMRIVRAILLGTLFCILYAAIEKIHISYNIYIINALLFGVFLSSSRLVIRLYSNYRHFSKGKRILIVGGGSAGEGIIRDLSRSFSVYQYIPAVIIDDDVSRHGSEIQGVRVVGTCKDIPKFVTKYKISLILIAIPSASSKQMREIVKYCELSKIPFRTLPSIKDIADGIVKSSGLREVLLEDLLGRDQIYLNVEIIKSTIENQIILVTGGGGSIGGELCRQICNFHPKKLIIVDNNEFNLYSIDMELQKKIDPSKFHAHLCSVTDKIELEKIFTLHKPSIVFHVAAYKHVPLLESNLRVAMHNNIIGTRIVSELSEKNHIKTFVLISTDKAVNPTNIMGATKRASEIFCQTYNKKTQTKFMTVRFGNVLNSAGSVIPLFRQQISLGGPLTVTHRDITRYFMTIPEASQLILQAAAIDEGHIFVLNMGEPIKINYLAEQMVKLSGKEIGKDIEIQYTGLRAGEKLHEELLYTSESICDTTHPQIKQAKVKEYDWNHIIDIINQIEIACEIGDENQLKKLLCKLVPEYQTTKISNTKDETKIPNQTLAYV